MTEPNATSEVVDLCRDLLRIDTTNTGDPDTSAGERAAAEYVAAKLSEVGLDYVIHESAPGRANLVTRIAGADPSRDALLVHGHLDVVPADASEWSTDPFGGEIRADGGVDYLWGRGAIDMKDFDAMMIAVARDWKRTGYTPPRDVVFAFTADEEAGSTYGAQYLVDEYPDLFDGCSEAIGEVGGFSVSVGSDLRLYLIQTAEKGLDWLRMEATGRPGHGSMINDENAVTALAEAVARVGSHRFPIKVTAAVRDFLEQISEVLGIELDPNDPELAIAKLGPIANLIGATLRDTANPTGLTAGYKDNVIPSKATRDDRLPHPAGPLGGVPCRAARSGRRRDQHGVRAASPGPGDDVRRPACRGDVGGAACRGRRRPADPVHVVRRDRRQGVRPARHAVFRILPAAAARRPQLRRVVSRH